MTAPDKPVILVLVGRYLPGFKGGGIPRSVENIVNHLHREFRFLVVTRDRDFGDDARYASVRTDQWQMVGNALVWYLAHNAESARQLRQLVQDTPHDLLYLNSFFDPLTARMMFNLRFMRMLRQPVLLAPRGEFAWASLRLKYPKKLLFMWLARLCGLFRSVAWHAASEFEAGDIARAMKVRREAIHVALDLPTLVNESPAEVTRSAPSVDEGGRLRVVFLSRISPEKNLDFALRVMSRVRVKVGFDIIGPPENASYWYECQRLLRQLPDNVSGRYLGSIAPAQVLRALKNYDLLFLPSGGESYGHVIAEALSVGTPVLISTNTPWRGLPAQGLGWDLPLSQPDAFVQVIDTIGSWHPVDRTQLRMEVQNKAGHLLSDPAVLDSNRQLFRMLLTARDWTRPRMSDGQSRPG